MRARGLERGEHRVLAVVPALGADAGGLAHVRGGAVGAHHERRLELAGPASVLDLHMYAPAVVGECAHVPCDALHVLELAEARGERALERGPRHHPAERLHPALVAAEPRDTGTPALGDVDEADGRGLGRERPPGAGLLQDAPAALGERDGALAAGRRVRLPVRAARLDHGDAQARGRERRERRADGPAAGDHHVEGTRRPAHAPTIASTVSGSLGSAALSTSQPSAVTATSSSMRTPMPRQRLRTPRASGAM